MKTRAALREKTGLPPYSQSKPMVIAEPELAPPGPGEVPVRIGAAGPCRQGLSASKGDRLRPIPIALR